MDLSDDDLEAILSNEGGFFDVGETIGSNYEVLEFIKEGADAEVYRVRNKTDGQEYAAKVPKDGNAAMQFEHEAELYNILSKRSRSGHLVKIYPAIEHEGCPVFIMEYLGGRSLQNTIDSPKPKSARRINRIISDVLKGLAELHDAGIIHCDVTPSNIILNKRGAVLLDLSASVIASKVTERTPRRGTNGYMPPDETPSYAWDIYSVGVIYYQLLLGNRPAWTRDPRGKEVTAQALAMPDNFGQYLGSRPILEKALSLDPKMRYFDAAEMLAEVNNPLHSERIGAGINIFRKRHPLTFIAGIICIILLLFFWFREDKGTNQQVEQLYEQYNLNLSYLDGLLGDLNQTSTVKDYREYVSEIMAARDSREGIIFVLESVELKAPKDKIKSYVLTLNVNELAHGRSTEIDVPLPWNDYTKSFYKEVEPSDHVAYGITKFSRLKIHLEGVKPFFNTHVEYGRVDFDKIQSMPDGRFKFTQEGADYSLRFDGFYVIPD